MINERDFFDQSIKSNLEAYQNIRKIATGDDHPTRCLLDYTYFRQYCKLIAIDLSKQQKPDFYKKAIQ